MINNPNIFKHFKSHTEDEIFEAIELTIISVDELVNLHIPLDLEDAKHLEAKKQNIIATLVQNKLYCNPNHLWKQNLIS